MAGHLRMRFIERCRPMAETQPQPFHSLSRSAMAKDG
ncbi:MAG: hypothetical protein K0S00_832 [Xanthobacteraceae bacterium]|jgi:hypothetical protein|nr:hypothetical protein [Xanthobacteraceae bacterium]